GHFVSSGVDPVKAVEQLLPRAYDLHLKDVKESGAHHNVPYGEGEARIEEILKVLVAHDYGGPVIIEFEKEEGDPTEGLRKCIEFLNTRSTAILPKGISFGAEYYGLALAGVKICLTVLNAEVVCATLASQNGMFVRAAG
ncbi:hypothetical protein B6U79_01610, partial [Candidatus Bathyarchaeota archaeon ex4484_231]